MDPSTISDRGTRRCEMTAATLDLPVLADGQLDSDQAPLQQLADAVAALWSAGTGLALPWSRAEEAPEQAVLSRLDRPFGRRACDLVALLEVPTRELLGRPLTRVRAHDQHDQGRIVVELSLAPA